jgi:hypothetical protein
MPTWFQELMMPDYAVMQAAHDAALAAEHLEKSKAYLRKVSNKTAWSSKRYGTVCFICMEDFKHGSLVHAIRCGHRLCPSCYDASISSGLKTCVVCPAIDEVPLNIHLVESFVSEDKALIQLFLNIKGPKAVTMRQTQSCLDLYTVAAALCESPPLDDLRLHNAGHDLPKDGTFLIDFGLSAGSTVEVVVRGRGGGKRGRAGEAATIDKDQVLRNLLRDAGMKLAPMSQNRTPAIASLIQRCLLVRRAMEQMPGQTLKSICDELPYPRIQKLLENVAQTPSSKLELRYQAVAKEIFHDVLQDLSDTEDHIREARAGMVMTIKAMLFSDFGDEAGNVNWRELAAVVVAVKAAKDQRVGAAAAASAASASLG